jgi:hypothetical protein
VLGQAGIGLAAKSNSCYDPPLFGAASRDLESIARDEFEPDQSG